MINRIGTKVSFLLIVMAVVTAGCRSGEERIERRADRLHAKMLTVDTHCDTPMRLSRGGYDIGVRNERGAVDFPRMKEGGLDAEFFAVYIEQGPRTPEAYAEVHGEVLAMIDLINENVNQYPEMAGLATSPEDAYNLKQEGKLSVFIGLENGYPIGLDPGKVREYYDLGARYITLCHSANNDICDSSTDPDGPEHDGLSPFGKEIIREMNRVGMMIDVSHMSDESFYDVLEITKAPVIASHSSCRALCESPRNLNDDMLQALKKNGGVIQICILSKYLKQPEPNPEFDAKAKELREKRKALGPEATEAQKEELRVEYQALKEKYVKLATVADAVNHIQHVVDVIGIEYVGIGTDFDGGGGIEGCMDVSQMKNITKELMRRGYSNADITRIWSGNIMRVMRDVEEARE